MSDNGFSREWVSVPVRVVRGQLVPCDPALLFREGARGEVKLPVAALTSRADSLSSEALFLSTGTEVRFPIRANRVPPDLIPQTLPMPKERTRNGRVKSPSLWVSVTLTQPLQSRTTQTGRVTLLGGACQIPALGCTARSLNHAYTLLSETFEPHRIGHTGSAWHKAHVYEDERWKPLDELRESRPKEPASRTIRSPQHYPTDKGSGQLF